MAKLSHDIARAVAAGFTAQDPQNPWMWSSAMWEAWEVGRYMNQTGRDISGLEKGRGSTWRTPHGSTYRAVYSKAKGGGSFGIERVN